jgi:hypothetical protein
MRMRHVTHMGEKRNAYKILVGKPEGKRPLDLVIDGRIVFYLFIYSLFNDAFSISDYIVSNERMIVDNELERSGRKRSWPNSRYCPGICLEGLRETTKNLGQDSRSPGQDLNPGSPEYEAGELTTRPQHSVRII